MSKDQQGALRVFLKLNKQEVEWDVQRGPQRQEEAGEREDGPRGGCIVGKELDQAGWWVGGLGRWMDK